MPSSPPVRFTEESLAASGEGAWGMHARAPFVKGTQKWDPPLAGFRRDDANHLQRGSGMGLEFVTHVRRSGTTCAG